MTMNIHKHVQKIVYVVINPILGPIVGIKLHTHFALKITTIRTLLGPLTIYSVRDCAHWNQTLFYAVGIMSMKKLLLTLKCTKLSTFEMIDYIHNKRLSTLE